MKVWALNMSRFLCYATGGTGPLVNITINGACDHQGWKWALSLEAHTPAHTNRHRPTHTHTQRQDEILHVYYINAAALPNHAPVSLFIYLVHLLFKVSRQKHKTKTTTDIIPALFICKVSRSSVFGKAPGRSASDCTYKLFFYSGINFMLPFQLMPHFDLVRTVSGFYINFWREYHGDFTVRRHRSPPSPFLHVSQQVYLSFWVWTWCFMEHF